ncbi:MAG: restriction endonuclease [Beijerinckiaceae bacterium]|nr:restriction endonuclease [Beijerinckiaceae bacterium]
MSGTPDGDALFYGDNLDILRNHIEDESVDLVYLDPPFNSNANYNVLFKSPDGSQSQSQIAAFDDTWHWTDSAEAAYDDVMRSGHSDAAEMLRAMRAVLKENDMMAYLAMMAVRLIELHRVLKPTGSLYLHCDPTASHYLKILLDAVFGVANFTSEVIWKRTSAHSSAKRYGPVHDTILYYRKSDSFYWHKIYQPYSDEYLEIFFDMKDADGRRWKRSDLTGADTRNGETGQSWRGIDVTAKGRHWAYSPSYLETLDKTGRIHWPKAATGVPRLKQYPEDLPGIPLQDVWTDLRPIHNLSDERLGYPTQKPVALLERILKASSNEGDLVLDPFCGCGTTIHAAEKLNRRWIGIDITHLAVGLIRDRLMNAFPMADFEVLGVPRDLAAAHELARADKHEFQLWALSMVSAQPYKGGRKGADGGVDGYIWFQPDGRNHEKAIVSVKGGENVDVKMIRDLIATVDREKAKVGIFITLTEPTRPMKTEAAAAGFYESPNHGRFAKIQIITIEDLFNQQKPHLPWIAPPSKRAKREKGKDSQIGFDL